MKQWSFWSMTAGVCGLAAALLIPVRAQADNLIGTGVVMVAARIGAPQNIQVVSGDEQTGEWIAGTSEGTVAAGLYDGTIHLLTPDMQYDIATLYLDAEDSAIYQGTIHYGQLAGAQVTTQFLGMPDELHSEYWTDVQWNGVEVQYYSITTTISSYNPD
jgi:hypothetical protein